MKNATLLVLAIAAAALLSGAPLPAADPVPTPPAQSRARPAVRSTTTLQDGTPVTTYEDGSKTAEYEPGSTYTQNADGSRTVGETVKTPAGQSIKIKTTYNPADGTRVTEYPDDASKKPEVEKPVAPPRVGKKGQKEFTYKDGTIVKFKGEDRVQNFEVDKHLGRETTKFFYYDDGQRRIEASGYRALTPAAGGSGAKISALIDNRPEYNVCVGGDASAAALQESFYQRFKSVGALDFNFKSLGGISGYGQFFSTNAPLKAYNDWLDNSGHRSCENFDAELNFCTLMAPLTGFRGHDHARHRGALHSHDAPDPPLSWGRKPPGVVVRLDRAERGK